MGMLACIAASVCLALTGRVSAGERWLWIAAALGCQFRLLCNMLDGMVALERRVASPVGELYNEVPDRVSDIAVFVGLGYATLSNPTLGWAAAVLAVLTAYVRAAAKIAAGPGGAQNYCGPMAKPHRMAVVTGLCVIMAITPTSWHGPFSLGEAVHWAGVITIPSIALWVIVLGCVITVVRRLLMAACSLQASHRTGT